MIWRRSRNASFRPDALQHRRGREYRPALRRELKFSSPISPEWSCSSQAPVRRRNSTRGRTPLGRQCGSTSRSAPIACSGGRENYPVRYQFQLISACQYSENLRRSGRRIESSGVFHGVTDRGRDGPFWSDLVEQTIEAIRLTREAQGVISARLMLFASGADAMDEAALMVPERSSPSPKPASPPNAQCRTGSASRSPPSASLAAARMVACQQRRLAGGLHAGYPIRRRVASSWSRKKSASFCGRRFALACVWQPFQASFSSTHFAFGGVPLLARPFRHVCDGLRSLGRPRRILRGRALRLRHRRARAERGGKGQG